MRRAVNNEYCVMFKRGAFDLGATVCPIAIKYNKIFVDAFWNSKRQSFTAHLVRVHPCCRLPALHCPACHRRLQLAGFTPTGTLLASQALPSRQIVVLGCLICT